MMEPPQRRRGALGSGRLATVVAAACLAAGLLPATIRAAPAPPLPDGADVMKRCVAAWYYPGKDMVARIRMVIHDRGGGKSYRVMTAFRRNQGAPGGAQRYLLYFHEPGDVRRMTCMVWKHVGGDDERWMFVPALNRTRRVTAPERSRFLGSDFVREEFSGRDAEADSHVVARFERHRGRPCWVVESVPRAAADHSRMTTWVDTVTYLPWKQEFRNRRDEVYRTFAADKVKAIRAPGGGAIPTIVERTMWGRDQTSRTRLIVEGVRYDVGLTEADFAEAHLVVPFDTWYRGPRP